MRILAVADSYMPLHYFQEALADLEADHKVEYFQVEDRSYTPRTPSELRIKEYLGAPSELCEHMAEVEALLVQGAPVTAEVLDASDELRIVGCAVGRACQCRRGGCDRPEAATREHAGQER